MTGVQRIYVRAPNWVGDLVMATTAFERLRAGFPDAEIVVAMKPFLRQLCEGSNWFDRVLDVPDYGGIRRLRREVADLRREKCDLAVVLPNSIHSGLVPFLAGIPRRLGYRQGRPGLMTMGPKATPNRRWWRFWHRFGPRRVPVPMPMYYEELLDYLEIPRGSLHPKLYVREEDRQVCADWLRERGIEEDQRLILMTVGASYGGSKLWPAEYFARTARIMADRGDVPILLTGPNEMDLLREIRAEAGRGVFAADPPLSFRVLKALCERASLMLTTDTGPRHLAVAFKLPLVCVIGPTDPRYTNYSLELQTLIQKELPCVPCQRKTCPLGHHDCMRLIGVDEVMAACDQWLDGSALDR